MQFINERRVNDYADRLRRFQWVWIRTREQFVIGDNPLCRWHVRKRRWNFGLNHKGVEVTMPLARNLCLRLQRAQCRATSIVDCDDKLTREYNARQILSAVYNVFGPQKTIRPICKRLVKDALGSGKLKALPRFAP
jgi:hypothetical protein